jgi:hypothetical protein
LLIAAMWCPCATTSSNTCCWNCQGCAYCCMRLCHGILTSGGVTLRALRTGQREADSELLLLVVLEVGCVGLDCSVGLSAASFALTRLAQMHAWFG